MSAYGTVEESYARVVICGQGPSWASVREEDLVAARDAGAAIVAVNGALRSFGGRPFTHWFTLDASAANLALMRRQLPGVRYYAAIPDTWRKRRGPPRYIPPGVIALHRRVREEPLLGTFEERVRRQIVGGLSEDPTAIHTGNSAFGALGLAYLMAPRRVVLLGVDAHGAHRWDGSDNGDLGHVPDLFAGAVPQLADAGVEVRNGSPGSAVKCWPVTDAASALAWISEPTARVALVLGGAMRVWRDLAALENLLGAPWPGPVVAANDAGTVWHRRLDHWVTLHPENMKRWKETRAALGLRPAGRHWAHREHLYVDTWSRQRAPFVGGSSGLFAVWVATAELGFDGAVLCGVPMDGGRNEFTGKPWVDFNRYRAGWERNAATLRPLVRSMSGWTREQFGAPDAEYLAAALAREATATTTEGGDAV